MNKDVILKVNSKTVAVTVLVNLVSTYAKQRRAAINLDDNSKSKIIQQANLIDLNAITTA